MKRYFIVTFVFMFITRLAHPANPSNAAEFLQQIGISTSTTFTDLANDLVTKGEITESEVAKLREKIDRFHISGNRNMSLEELKAIAVSGKKYADLGLVTVGVAALALLALSACTGSQGIFDTAKIAGSENYFDDCGDGEDWGSARRGALAKANMYCSGGYGGATAEIYETKPYRWYRDQGYHTVYTSCMYIRVYCRTKSSR